MSKQRLMQQQATALIALRDTIQDHQHILRGMLDEGGGQMPKAAPMQQRSIRAILAALSRCC
jgi:hypothetical protein